MSHSNVSLVYASLIVCDADDTAGIQDYSSFMYNLNANNTESNKEQYFWPCNKLELHTQIEHTLYAEMLQSTKDRSVRMFLLLS